MARAALVTGGSSGIGFAIARMLRDEGFDVTVASRTADKLERAAKELGAHAVVTDVSDEGECIRLVTEHRERYGRTDVLVNCAGVGIGGNVESMSTKHWDLQFDVNMRGAFVITRESIPMLKEAKGLIVNIASIAGTGPARGIAAYGAAKAALIAFTRSLNAELTDDGVRATAICPGFVDTPMAAWTGMSSEEMIQPEDCAEVVRALLRLSPAARIPQVVIERLGA
jgi:NAD(P)-dependent dehydrogenase (short-subunit alcohol dehydrogenase family)